MAAIIQFSDGTYHGGGTAYLKPVKNINSAKTYISVGKALAVLRSLHGSRCDRYTEHLHGAIIWEVEYSLEKGHMFTSTQIEEGGAE